MPQPTAHRNFAGRLAPLSLLFALLLLNATIPAVRAQDRPLQTPDAETVPAGTLRTAVGFDFLQGISFPMSGLEGDMSSVGDLDLRLGVGRAVEVELQGTVQNFLNIKKQGASFVSLNLSSTNSTRDVGDFSLWTKIRIIGEGKRRPAFAFKFGFEMPNSNQARGIGTNTTNVFASVVLERHFWNLKVFGDAGVGILQSPLASFSQNDVIVYGGAFSYPLHRRVNLVGEVAGRQSTRKINAGLVGTESRSQARVGLQIFAGGFQWDVAAIAGLQKFDPTTGFTFGVSRDFHLYNPPGDSK